MNPSPNQLVWILAACATLVGQVVPQAFCSACDRPCCASAPAGGCCTTATEEEGCPLCAAAAGDRRDEISKFPCHCQLEARNDQPLSQPRHIVIGVDHDVWTSAPATFTPDAPPVLGVSREYLASALTVPIRPPRILFGVWRN